MLAERGLPTLDLDEVGHRALYDWALKQSLVDAFGSDIVDEKGHILRKALAKKAFGTPRATEVLNGITQPWIKERLGEWLKAQEAAGAFHVAVEVSAFAGPDELREVDFDKLIVVAVVAPVETRLKRAEAGGFDADDISARMSRQPTDAEQREWADHIIENDGTFPELRRKVDLLMEKLSGRGND